ncbi:MAG TPA: aldo/keto reductase [Clostridia bacterium]|nr:aldo/keto reductase [Clostridia bacterium]
MRYKKYGNSGAEVSVLGFGCMRFPMIRKDSKEYVDEDQTIPMLRRAYELGVNYFDTAYFYCNGQSEIVLGKALKGIRDKVYVSTKSPGHLVKKPGDYRRILEEQLKKLDMDVIDFYHFHGIGYDGFYKTDSASGWLKDAQKAKEEGLIRHVSFSFHDDPKAMLKLIDTGLFESVLCQYNAIDKSNAEGIAYAKSKGLGVAVMGPLGGGRVSGMPREVADKLGIQVKSSAELALRFVLANPGIDIALSGMGSMQMVEENIATASNTEPLSKQELDAINAMMEENEKLAKLYCTGCSYCMPCPQNVNIPHIFRTMNYYRIYNTVEYARNEYANIGSEWIPGKNASACTECGACEKKCPQKLKIREQLKESHAALSGK